MIDRPPSRALRRSLITVMMSRAAAEAAHVMRFRHRTGLTMEIVPPSASTHP
jgi:hypothetical protein